MPERRVAIIGYGKIARDQHVPAIAGDPRFRLAAVVAPGGAPDCPVPVFADHRAMLAAGGIDAVAICTPAGPRYGIARDCLAAGLDALLEKPPTATLGEIEDLAAFAQDRGRVLFTTWHAQYNPAVTRLERLLREEGLETMRIEWLEDVNKWHPGQSWIWGPGGFGVFDAGINALSIASLVAPARLIVRDAALVLHAGGQQPIAATMSFHAAGVPGPVTARFDWRHTDDERWTIEGRTGNGTPFTLARGGSELAVRGVTIVSPNAGSTEYGAVYTQFAELIGARRSLVDREPLRLVADTLLVASR